MITTIATAATTVADHWDGDRPDFWSSSRSCGS